MCEFKGLTGQCGKRNPPGLRAKIYLIPASELTAQPRTLKEVTPATTVKGATKILGEEFEYVTTTGKGFWREVDVLIDSSSIDISTEGEIGNLSFKNGLNFVINGTAAEESEFADELLNCCVVAAVQLRAEEAHYKIVGRYDDPAHVEEVTGGSGLKVGDRNAMAFKLRDFSGEMLPQYPVSLGLTLTPNP